jgi:hypothetical protein
MNRSVFIVAAGITLASALPSWAQEPDAPVATSRANEDLDGVRFRGGFGIHGGLGLVSTTGGAAQGPLAALSVRLGVQFNHSLALFYQQMPQLFGMMTSGGVTAMFLDYNALLLNVTLGDMFEIGVGPSFDYISMAALTGVGLTSGSGTGFGVHGRTALIFGSRIPGVARRSGFTLGVDLHPVFFEGGTLFMLTLGVGSDWY